MKRVLIGVLLLIVVTLSGCGSKAPILHGPKDFKFNKQTNVLSWQKDDDALSYKLLIDDEVIHVNETFYDMSHYELGSYTVRVSSVYKDTESMYTTQLIITIKETITAPTNLSFDNETNFVSWDKDVYATSYQLSINDQIIDVDENMYDLSAYQPNQYIIKVKALFNGKSSPFSEPLTVIINETMSLALYIKDNQIHLTKITNATYSYQLRVDITNITDHNQTGIIDIPMPFRERVIDFKVDVYLNKAIIYTIETVIDLRINTEFNTEDLIIEVKNPRAVFIDDVLIEATLSADKVIISKDILITLDEEVILSVVGDTYIIKRLFITEPTVQHASPKVINASEALRFSFELNGFTFKRIAKDEFKLNEDYFFNEGVLTFSDTFIEKYQSLFPDAKEVNLMAVFTREGKTDLSVWLSITIKLDA